MSTATIKSIQQSGTTWEVLAVTDAGQLCRVQTDGGLASLVSGLQTQTAQLTARQTKPELSVGQVVDFTPVVPVVVIPSDAEIARGQWFTDYRAMKQYAAGLADGFPGFDQGTLDAMRADLGKRFDPSYTEMLR